MSFIETCDTFDRTKWGYWYGPPDEAVNSEWVFNFPAGTIKNMQAVHLEDVGYGRYRVRFRTSGPRVTGTNYFVFLYNDSPHNELDIPELFGAHESKVLSISYHRNGVDGYWYFDCGTMNFEDGAIHEWEFLYTADRLEFYLDGVLLFEYNEDPDKLILPIPPMKFVIGGSGKGTATESFQFIIDEIQYTTPKSTFWRILDIIAGYLGPIGVGLYLIRGNLKSRG